MPATIKDSVLFVGDENMNRVEFAATNGGGFSTLHYSRVLRSNKKDVHVSERNYEKKFFGVGRVL